MSHLPATWSPDRSRALDDLKLIANALTLDDKGLALEALGRTAARLDKQKVATATAEADRDRLRAAAERVIHVGVDTDDEHFISALDALAAALSNPTATTPGGNDENG